MKTPEISIVVPCYNQAQYLEECINSVLTQTFQHWECIIINDGSQDNTEEIALKLTKSDDRIKYLKKENGGLSSARNSGIEQALGTYILALDADDKIADEYIEKAIAEFRKDKNLNIVYFRAAFFGLKSGEYKLGFSSVKNALIYNPFYCSAIFKKEEWKEVGGYDIHMIYGYEDWEFWINLFKHHHSKVKKIDYLGFFYRIKEVSMITLIDENSKKKELMMDYIEHKHHKLYLEHYGTKKQLFKKYDTLAGNLKNPEFLQKHISFKDLMKTLYLKLLKNVKF